MKNLSKIIPGTLLLLCLAASSQAQIRDIMLKKAGDKMKANKQNTTTNQSKSDTTRTENAGNTNGDKVEDQNAKYQQNANSNPYATYGMSKGGSKDIRASYTFEQNILMEMKKFDKKGNQDRETQKMRMHFGKEAYTGVEAYDDKNESRGFSVFEADKSQMVMLMENNGKKIAMVHKIDPSKYAKQEETKGDKKPTITKTGRTKKVCGYTCEEWTSVDDKGEKTEMWISSEVPIKNNAWYTMFGSQNKDYGKYFGNGSDYPTGMMLEMIHYDSNGEKFTMTATEVNLNAPKTIDTSGYQVF